MCCGRWKLDKISCVGVGRDYFHATDNWVAKSVDGYISSLWKATDAHHSHLHGISTSTWYQQNLLKSDDRLSRQQDDFNCFDKFGNASIAIETRFPGDNFNENYKYIYFKLFATLLIWMTQHTLRMLPNIFRSAEYRNRPSNSQIRHSFENCCLNEPIRQP